MPQGSCEQALVRTALTSELLESQEQSWRDRFAGPVGGWRALCLQKMYLRGAVVSHPNEQMLFVTAADGWYKFNNGAER